MSEKTLRHGCTLAVSFLFAFFIFGLSSAKAVTIYGVTSGNQLVRFDSAMPGTLNTIGSITGLQSGENILGIDFRPATGQFFALGSTSRLYTINKLTGAATQVGVLSTAISGVEFGFDFNPSADRIRIISNTGQNLRVNPNDASVTVDGALNPGTPNVTAAGYLNSFSGAATTTLFDIDTSTNPDTLYIQNPPNSGTLTMPLSLGVNATDTNGFDISSADNTAYAALTVSAVTGLYTINTTTGATTLVGPIGTGTTSLRGIAVDIGSPAQNLVVVGLTTTNQLVRFNSARPNTILSTVSITGLQSGENLLGIDFRPATGQLFGLGSMNRVYTINPVTGAATSVGMPGLFMLNGTDFGVDFNPVPDRIRVVSNLGQNLRLNPNDGTLSGTDTMMNPGTPQVAAAGYTNSFSGATATTLYVIDTASDTMNLQGGINGTPSPNGGTLTPVGPLGVNTTSNVGFDIASGNNTALAAFQLMGDTASKLYSVNLTSGVASFIGPVGTAVPLRGIAIVPGSAASSAVDFDGDRRADYSVFRTAENNWYINRSSTNTSSTTQFGLSQSDTLTPGDYDGDGKADIAVWRGTNGVFYVIRSSDNVVQFFPWGLNGDEPVARDYDGDGKTDFAVVRRTGGAIIWYISNSSNSSFRAEQFGLDSDFTATGDYDGDGRFDLGVRRGTGSQQAFFYVQRSRDGFTVVPWGLGSDLIVPGDYDGDGKTDFTALRQGTNYTWFILQSSNGNFVAPQFGTKPHFATQADYDGDGKTDVAVWDPLTGIFYTLRSSTSATVSYQYGQNGDVPVAGFDTH